MSEEHIKIYGSFSYWTLAFCLEMEAEELKGSNTFFGDLPSYKDYQNSCDEIVKIGLISTCKKKSKKFKKN